MNQKELALFDDTVMRARATEKRLLDELQDARLRVLELEQQVAAQQKEYDKQREIGKKWCDLAMEMVAILRESTAPGTLQEADAPRALRGLRTQVATLRVERDVFDGAARENKAAALDYLQRAEAAEGLLATTPRDNPDMDGTDAANPAWWRGNDHAHQVLCKEVNEYLDGKELGTGVCCEPWQSTRKRLVQLRKELRTLWIHLLS